MKNHRLERQTVYIDKHHITSQQAHKSNEHHFQPFYDKNTNQKKQTISERQSLLVD